MNSNLYKIIKTLYKNNEKTISIIEIENKKFILKQISSTNKNLVNMLKNETNILYKLKDTNICSKIYSYKFEENNNLLITELIKGKTINRLNLNTKEKILLMLKIAEAIKDIHKLNIIHCDLKPENIMLDINKNIKIIDYGISIDNGINYFKGFGSIKYCSKYQLLKDNNNIDKKTDIYSLGIIFYELILGKLPFDGTKKEIIEKKLNNTYEKTDNVLLNLIFSKLFDDTNERCYQTIEEFENDLKLFSK